MDYFVRKTYYNHVLSSIIQLIDVIHDFLHNQKKGEKIFFLMTTGICIPSHLNSLIHLYIKLWTIHCVYMRISKVTAISLFHTSSSSSSFIRNIAWNRYSTSPYIQKHLLFTNKNRRNSDKYPPNFRLFSSNMNDTSSSTSPVQKDLSSFLKDLKSETHKSKKEKKTQNYIIMGNEAGDADSVVSALTLAYILNHQSQSHSDSDSHINDAKSFIPMISIPKADMPLRRDVILLLESCGINVMSDLMYLDDVVLQSYLSKVSESDASNVSNDIQMILTDHNAIRKDLSHLSSNVCLILDHHQDENQHLHLNESTNNEQQQHQRYFSSFSNRDIAFENGKGTVGSSCTLVTERIKCDMEENFLPMNPSISFMLLGTILLDTSNMNPNAGKGTDRDQKAVDYLLQQSSTWKDLTLPSNLQHLTTDTNTKTFFDWLNNARSDPQFWNEMSTTDCLRIDYKQYYYDDSSFGLSTVLLSLSDIVSKPNFLSLAQSYMMEKQITFLGIMSSIHGTEGNERSMLLISTNEDLLHSMVDYLLNHPETTFLDLKEMPIPIDSSSDTPPTTTDLVWKGLAQGNSKGSRKQVAPIMMKFFNGQHLD